MILSNYISKHCSKLIYYFIGYPKEFGSKTKFIGNYILNNSK